jgi:hypothetical protein
MSDKNSFHKILALAVNPGAPDGEAQAALGKLRELVRQNPSLTMPPAPPPMPAPPPPKPPNDSYSTKITYVGSFWFLIVLNSLSEKAFNLGLQYQLTSDPLISKTPMTIQVRYDGPPYECQAFGVHINWLIDYINSQPPQP